MRVGSSAVMWEMASWPSSWLSLSGQNRPARACIEAARSLRDVVTDVATRSGLESEGVRLRFGPHWGSTLYVGSISTADENENVLVFAVRPDKIFAFAKGKLQPYTTCVLRSRGRRSQPTQPPAPAQPRQVKPPGSCVLLPSSDAWQ